jgi:pimeloyl-ACP methyl ester carboxylesterase
MDRALQQASTLPLVIIPGAGGFYARTAPLVERCRAAGAVVLVDYPPLAWHMRPVSMAELVAELRARIAAEIGARPCILAGESLGAVIATLLAGDPGPLTIAGVLAVDPARARTTQLQSGWAGRTLGRARRAGGAGLPHFIWVRANRTLARVIAPRLRRGSTLARIVTRLLAGGGSSLFGRQLRMRLLIDTAAAWNPVPPAQPAAIPCTVFHTADRPPETDFWQAHFARADYRLIAGDHDTWIDHDGPAAVVARWQALSPAASLSRPA